MIQMYGACGSLEEARRVFESIDHPNGFSWNILLTAYAQRGHLQDSKRIFDAMPERDVMEGVEPDEISFMGTLVACSYKGVLLEGIQIFQTMIQGHGLEPRQEHYSCMISILGRAGDVRSAEWLLQSMPFRPDSVAWAALLSSCKIHDESVLGVRAAKNAFRTRAWDATPYVLLSNLCLTERKLKTTVKELSK
ncbi:hypothetical protein SELMODRAFT_108163 [Selaginella moellendorffii]|uniref:Pentacotripeptide-repeat region of PRORP domain-containing protein n=1 Tax=Selaginella moellendorffii TaxID=88036 RepID=D8S3P6_SELML|nr:hypothetical protein SELMODRAFT_108163 [Selaginella moellendorffii]